MTFDVDTVYGLLPAVYRTRDAAVAVSLGGLLTAAEQAEWDGLQELATSGAGLDAAQQRALVRLEETRTRGPLKALLTVIAEQMAAVEDDIEQLYDDQFIETCADWVVPYIADLVGHHPLDPVLQEQLRSSRAEVADTIGLRRRKGTAAVMEDLAVSVTGWDAAVVEFFLRLATTQHVDHVRKEHHGQVDLRRADDVATIGSPFDRAAHTLDVRRVATGRGRFNIPNVAVFLWRVVDRSVTDADAFRVDSRRYRFDPLGVDTQLVQAPARRRSSEQGLAGADDVPLPITRRQLRARLDELWGRSMLVTVGGVALAADEVEACDLSDTGPDPETSPWAHAGQVKVAIDPVLGRIAFPADPGGPVHVSYRYGSVVDIGGGEYPRADATAVPADEPRVPDDWATITEALGDRNGTGVVPIVGSGRYAETPVVVAAANARLRVGAVDGSRPLLLLGGDLVVAGGDSGEVVLDGLLITGGRVVAPAVVDGRPNLLQRLVLVDCTLVPEAVSLVVEAPGVTVDVQRCILGGLRVAEGSRVSIAHSIVDGLGPENVAFSAPNGSGAGGAMSVESSTVVGKVRTTVLQASDSILHAALAPADTWTSPVVAERRQSGYVRYSYVPLGSRVPRRFACQPLVTGAGGETAIVPAFTSRRYGDAAYGQLHAACPRVIARGASDNGEMGALHGLLEPQREASLRARLDEYLRFGLEAGLFFAS